MSMMEREASWEVREATSDGVALELSGIAVPYNSPTDIGGYREQFAPGAFDPNQVVGTPLFWRHGEVVGRVTSAENTDAGLLISGQVLDTTLGRDAATLVRGGASTGLSVGFIPQKSSQRSGVVTHTSAHLHELSLTPVPAYAGAVITEAREETPTMIETPAASAAEVGPGGVDIEAREQIQTLSAAVADLKAPRLEVREAHPLAEVNSFGAFLREVAEVRSGRNGERLEVLARALDTATTPDNAGTMPPAWVADVVRQIDNGRPTVSAIGPRALPANGMTVTYRKAVQASEIDAQLSELAEVASTAFQLDTATANVGTYAGGVRVSLQEILRSDPAYLNELQTDMVTSWNRKTNADAITLLSSGTGLGSFTTLDPAGIGATLGAAAADIATAGGSMSVVLLAPGLFYAIAAAAGQGYPFAGGNVGGASFTSGSFAAMGTRFIMDSQLSAGTGYALDPSAVRWWEAGPYFISADEPSVLGRDVACYSFAASAVVNPAAIVALSD